MSFFGWTISATPNAPPGKLCLETFFGTGCAKTRPQPNRYRITTPHGPLPKGRWRPRLSRGYAIQIHAKIRTERRLWESLRDSAHGNRNYRRLGKANRPRRAARGRMAKLPMAKIIRFQTSRGDCVTADELREVSHRVQLARLVTLDAERRLRELCERARDGALVEECELTLDPLLGMLFELPRTEEHGS